MNFNPLFMSSANTVNSKNGDGTKESKFNNSNYIFANIINVSSEKLASVDQEVVIDEKNKSLFSNLKSNVQNTEKPGSAQNNFVTDVAKLSTFLSNILERTTNTANSQSTGNNENKSPDLSAIPEHVVSFVNALNLGEKISIPVVNNGKNIFVEVQKVVDQPSPKVITLASKEISELQFSDLDLDKVVSDISNALSKILPQVTPTITDEKVADIISEVKNSFTNLIAVNNEKFTPQTNVLGQLVNNIEKKFDLSAEESTNIKNTIVTEFVNQIKATIDVKNSSELKDENESPLVPINAIVHEFNLTPDEAKVVDNLGLGKINVAELKGQIKKELLKSGNNTDLQLLLNKLDNNEYISSLKPVLDKNEVISVQDFAAKLNLTAKEVDAVKKVVSENITVPELSNKLKVAVGKENTPVELKSIEQKLSKYENSVSTRKIESGTEKLPLKELANKLNLTANEVKVVKKVVSEKLTLPELSNKLEVAVGKENTHVELKLIEQKLSKFENSVSATKIESGTEKLPLNELASKLNLTTKEVDAVKKVVSENITVPELSNKLKVAVGKENTPVELKLIEQKLSKYENSVSTTKIESATEKLPFKELANKLKLTAKEVDSVKKVVSENITVPELSKKLKVAVGKENTPVELKSIEQKLSKYENSLSATKIESGTEKLPFKELANKLNLTVKEVEAFKKVIAEKISLPDLSKELKFESKKPFAQTEIKSLSQKVDTYLDESKIKNLNVTAETLSKAYNLSKNDLKTLKNLGLGKIDPKELKLALTTEIVKNPTKVELKTLLTKVSRNSSLNMLTPTELHGNKVDGKNLNKFASVRSVEKNLTTNEIPISNTKSIEDNSDYLVSIKSSKSSESILFDGKLNFGNKTPELLKSSIYASKESSELNKLKVVPLEEEVKKDTFRLGENNRNKLSKKTTYSLSPTKSGNNNDKTSSEGNNTNTSENSNKDNPTSISQTPNKEYTKNTFEKEIFASNSTENKSANVEKHEKDGKSIQHVDNKLNEIVSSKPTIVGHQIRNQSLVINDKIIHKHIDIKNIKQEISNLMQQGEKKTVEFSLTPENLGKLQVKLEVINKVVSASIKVDNEMTQQIVQQSLDGLKSSLNQNGVLYNSLNVSLSNSEEKNNRFFKQKRKHNQEYKDNIQELDEQFVHKQFGYNKYDFIA